MKQYLIKELVSGKWMVWADLEIVDFGMTTDIKCAGHFKKSFGKKFLSMLPPNNGNTIFKLEKVYVV